APPGVPPTFRGGGDRLVSRWDQSLTGTSCWADAQRSWNRRRVGPPGCRQLARGLLGAGGAGPVSEPPGDSVADSHHCSYAESVALAHTDPPSVANTRAVARRQGNDEAGHGAEVR